VKRYKTEIVADQVILLSTNPNGATHEPDTSFPDDDYQKAEKAKRAATTARIKSEENISIDDIPF
jgi:hypothetical protein